MLSTAVHATISRFACIRYSASLLQPTPTLPLVLKVAHHHHAASGRPLICTPMPPPVHFAVRIAVRIASIVRSTSAGTRARSGLMVASTHSSCERPAWGTSWKSLGVFNLYSLCKQWTVFLFRASSLDVLLSVAMPHPICHCWCDSSAVCHLRHRPRTATSGVLCSSST
jgi:hypothetical protein